MAWKKLPKNHKPKKHREFDKIDQAAEAEGQAMNKGLDKEEKKPNNKKKQE